MIQGGALMARKQVFLALEKKDSDIDEFWKTWEFICAPHGTDTTNIEQLQKACSVTLGDYSLEDLQSAFNEVSLHLPCPRVITWPEFRLFMTTYGNHDGVQQIHYVTRDGGDLTGATTLAKMLHTFCRMRETHGIVQAAATRELHRSKLLRGSLCSDGEYLEKNGPNSSFCASASVAPVPGTVLSAANARAMAAHRKRPALAEVACYTAAAHEGSVAASYFDAHGLHDYTQAGFTSSSSSAAVAHPGCRLPSHPGTSTPWAQGSVSQSLSPAAAAAAAAAAVAAHSELPAASLSSAYTSCSGSSTHDVREFHRSTTRMRSDPRYHSRSALTFDYLNDPQLELPVLEVPSGMGDEEVLDIIRSSGVASGIMVHPPFMMPVHRKQQRVVSFNQPASGKVSQQSAPYSAGDSDDDGGGGNGGGDGGVDDGDAQGETASWLARSRAQSEMQKVQALMVDGRYPPARSASALSLRELLSHSSANLGEGESAEESEEGVDDCERGGEGDGWLPANASPTAGFTGSMQQAPLGLGHVKFDPNHQTRNAKFPRSHHLDLSAAIRSFSAAATTRRAQRAVSRNLLSLSLGSSPYPDSDTGSSAPPPAESPAIVPDQQGDLLPDTSSPSVLPTEAAVMRVSPSPTHHIPSRSTPFQPPDINSWLAKHAPRGAHPLPNPNGLGPLRSGIPSIATWVTSPSPDPTYEYDNRIQSPFPRNRTPVRNMISPFQARAPDIKAWLASRAPRGHTTTIPTATREAAQQLSNHGGPKLRSYAIPPSETDTARIIATPPFKFRVRTLSSPPRTPDTAGPDKTRKAPFKLGSCVSPTRLTPPTPNPTNQNTPEVSTATATTDEAQAVPRLHSDFVSLSSDTQASFSSPKPAFRLHSSCPPLAPTPTLAVPLPLSQAARACTPSGRAVSPAFHWGRSLSSPSPSCTAASELLRQNPHIRSLSSCTSSPGTISRTTFTMTSPAKPAPLDPIQHSHSPAKPPSRAYQSALCALSSAASAAWLSRLWRPILQMPVATNFSYSTSNHLTDVGYEPPPLLPPRASQPVARHPDQGSPHPALPSTPPSQEDACFEMEIQNHFHTSRHSYSPFPKRTIFEDNEEPWGNEEHTGQPSPDPTSQYAPIGCSPTLTSDFSTLNARYQQAPPSAWSQETRDGKAGREADRLRSLVTVRPLEVIAASTVHGEVARFRDSPIQRAISRSQQHPSSIKA